MDRPFYLVTGEVTKIRENGATSGAGVLATYAYDNLSERCGFSQQYLSGLERGRRNPTVVTLYELAQALEVLSCEPG